MNSNNKSKPESLAKDSKAIQALTRRVDKLETLLATLARQVRNTKTKGGSSKVLAVRDQRDMSENCKLRCSSYLTPTKHCGDPVIITSFRVPVLSDAAGTLPRSIRVMEGRQEPFKYKFSASAAADGQIVVMVFCDHVGWSDHPSMLITTGGAADVRSQAGLLPNQAGAFVTATTVGSINLLKRGGPAEYGERNAYLKDMKLSMDNNQVSNLNLAGGIISGFIKPGVTNATAHNWGYWRSKSAVRTFDPKHDKDFPIVRLPPGDKSVNNLLSTALTPAFNVATHMGYMFIYATGVDPGKSFDFTLEGCVHYFGRDIMTNGVPVRQSNEAVGCVANAATAMSSSSFSTRQADEKSLARDLPKVMWDSLSENLPLPGPVRAVAKSVGDKLIDSWTVND